MNQEAKSPRVLSWFEPPLFRMRTITRRGWIRRLWAFGLVLSWYIASYFIFPKNQRSPSFESVAFLGFLAGIAAAFVVDFFWLIRYVWIDAKSINYHSLLSWRFSMQNVSRLTVESIQLLPGFDPQNRWDRDVMIVRTKRDGDVVLAVRISLDDVANRLREIGYSNVTLGSQSASST